MRILHIINTLELGGAQSVLIQLIQKLKLEKHESIVISLRNQKALSGNIEKLGIPLIHLDFEPGKYKFGNFIKLLNIAINYQPDIIQTWLYHSDLAGSLIKIFLPFTPVIWGVHHTTNNKNSVRKSTWSIIKLLAFISKFIPTKIICCSSSAYNSHIDLGYPKQKTEIIENGIDIDKFIPDKSAGNLLRNELGLSKSTKLIGMFARYHPQKDYHTLLDAASIMIKSMPNVHFLLAGQDVDQTNMNLVEIINAYNMHDNVHLLGAREDIPRLAAGIDIFTLSSSFGEAMPQVIGEAMACGTPCVSTNVGDIKKIIGNAGIITEPKNPNGLVAAWKKIFSLSKSDIQKLKQKSRNQIAEKYSSVKMSNKYIDLYENALNRQRVGNRNLF